MLVTDEVSRPFDPLVLRTAEVVHLPESDAEVSLQTDEEEGEIASLDSQRFAHTSEVTVASPEVVVVMVAVPEGNVSGDGKAAWRTSDDLHQKDKVTSSVVPSSNAGNTTIPLKESETEDSQILQRLTLLPEVKVRKEEEEDEAEKTPTDSSVKPQVLSEQTTIELTSTSTEKLSKSKEGEEGMGHHSSQFEVVTSSDTINRTSGQVVVFPETATSLISTTSERETTESRHSVELTESTQSTEGEGDVHLFRQTEDKLLLEKTPKLPFSSSEISTSQPAGQTSSTTLTITTFASSSLTATPTIVTESTTVESLGGAGGGGGGNLTESISTSSSSYYVEPHGSFSGFSLQRSAGEEFGAVGAEGDLLSSASSSSSPSWAAEGGGPEEKVHFGGGGDLMSTSSTTPTLTRDTTDEVNITQFPPPDTPTTLTTTTTMSFVLSGTSSSSGGVGTLESSTGTGNGVGSFGPTTDYSLIASTPVTSTTATMTTTIGFQPSQTLTGNGNATHSSSVITGSSSSTTSPKPSNSNSFDVDRDWGRPLGLPSPAPPPSNVSISAKLPPLPPQTGSGSNSSGIRSRPRTPDRRSSIGSNSTTTVGAAAATATSNGLSHSSGRSNAHQHPVYVELAYVPGHGRRGYVDETFFQRVRARYYVFSGVTPSREVFDALLTAKGTWDTPSNLYVTIIPTYESEALLSWIADNQRRLTELRIDVTPAANRCSINLAEDGDGATPTEESCSAYKVEL